MEAFAVGLVACREKSKKRGLGASTGGMVASRGGVLTLPPVPPLLYYLTRFSFDLAW